MLSSFLMALSYQDVFNAIMCLDSSMTVEAKKKKQLNEKDTKY